MVIRPERPTQTDWVVLPGSNGMSGHLGPVGVLGDDGTEYLGLVVLEGGGHQVGHQLVPALRLQAHLHLLVVQEDEGLRRGDSDHHVVPGHHVFILIKFNASNTKII